MLTHDVPKRKFLPVLERSEPLIKDHSAVKEFMYCKRKYFYRMVVGRTARKSNLESIFAWGSAIHKFAELYSSGSSFQDAVKEANLIYKKPLPDSKWSHLNLDRFAATVIEVAKFLDLEKQSGYVKTVSVESPFNIELPDGSIIGGRTDALIKFGGQVWIRDYKTTTKRIDYFTPSLDPNDQATRYVYGISKLMGWDSATQISSAKANGVEFVVINNEADTKTSKKKPKIEKRSITRSHDQLVSFERQQMFINRMITFCREEDEWPMEPSNNCQWCDYVRVCRAPTEENMAVLLKSEFVHSPWDHQKVEQEAL